MSVINIGAPLTFNRGWAEQEYRLANAALQAVYKKSILEQGDQYSHILERRDAALAYLNSAVA